MRVGLAAWTLATLGMARGLAAAPAPGAPGDTAGPAPTLAPSPGDVIPSFAAEGIEGGVQQVSFPKGSTTVLLFFLSGCRTCHKMIPEWNRAYERRPPSLKVLGIVMDREPPGFFTAMPLAFPVVRSPGREFLQALKIQRAPLTLRVGAGGKVEDVALGLVDPIRLGELFRR